MSRGDEMSPRFQREPLHGLERTPATAEELDKAAWELSGAVEYVTRLLPSQFFSYMYDLLSINTFYIFDDEKTLE